MQKEQTLNQFEDNAEKKSLTFCFIHGSWHAAWCWKHQIAVLQEAGHKAYASDMPIDNPDATLKDYGHLVAETITDEKNTVVVAHSRMAAVVPIIAGELSLHSSTLLCPGFPPEYNPLFWWRTRSRIPHKYGPDFESGILPVDGSPDLKVYDREKAKQVFYHDCDPETQQWAASLLRPMHRPKKSGLFSRWPKHLKASMIYTSGDRVISPKYSEYVARALGLRAYVMSGGHCPFLSKPFELAQMLEHISLNSAS